MAKDIPSKIKLPGKLDRKKTVRTFARLQMLLLAADHKEAADLVAGSIVHLIHGKDTTALRLFGEAIEVFNAPDVNPAKGEIVENEEKKVDKSEAVQEGPTL